jgi:hypothetical protein
MFFCAIEENTMILCERHAQAFEAAALIAKTPHTIYELEDEDVEHAVCHACDLQDELTSQLLTHPQIILPGEF